MGLPNNKSYCSPMHCTAQYTVHCSALTIHTCCTGHLATRRGTVLWPHSDTYYRRSVGLKHQLANSLAFRITGRIFTFNWLPDAQFELGPLQSSHDDYISLFQSSFSSSDFGFLASGSSELSSAVLLEVSSFFSFLGVSRSITSFSASSISPSSSRSITSLFFSFSLSPVFFVGIPC